EEDAVPVALKTGAGTASAAVCDYENLSGGSCERDDQKGSEAEDEDRGGGAAGQDGFRFHILIQGIVEPLRGRVMITLRPRSVALCQSVSPESTEPLPLASSIYDGVPSESSSIGLPLL